MRTAFVGRRVRVGLGIVSLNLVALLGSSCDSVSQPTFIQGVSVTGNESPTLTILRPRDDISISRGETFVIEWLDTDRDDNARISFELINVNDPDDVIVVVNDIAENDSEAADRFTVNTAFIPFGTYNLLGRIADGVNRQVTAVALNEAVGVGQVEVRIVEPGTASVSNLPPQVFVRDPAFDLSVSQDDTVTIVVQPTPVDPNVDPALGALQTDPYDVDSTVTLYLFVDLDDDPLNDDFIAPDPSELIPLGDPVEIVAGDFTQITFPVTISLDQVPLRSDGSAYRIRATITDDQNVVHSYAAGTLNVVRAASGAMVDLGQIGKTVSGAKFIGFNPGSRLGTKMISVQDFDLDGIDDFMLVAQFGNPRNFGNIGEAYLIYGLNRRRFGGEINVNSTARTIPGVIFEAPPVRTVFRCGGSVAPASPRTDGITDVAFIPDLTGDNRPELLFGMAHTDGIVSMRDDDPSDSPPEGDETLDITIVIRQGAGTSELTEQAAPNDIVTVFSYFGMEDVTIDEAQPGTNFRSDDRISWSAVPGARRWVLIKLKDILGQFPTQDTPDRIASISASLAFRVTERGGNATVHELFSDFDESTTNFANFGEPVAGIDYDQDEIGAITADNEGEEQTVSLDRSLQLLLIGGLTDVSNEIRLIIVPSDAAGDDPNPASVASKEFSIDERDRPTLTLTYNRELLGGPLGCYPDNFPNNMSDEPSEIDGCGEFKYEALGTVALFHSENRDATGLIDPNRLTATTASLELAGMRVNFPLELGIEATTQAVGTEAGRMAGCRIHAGQYDFYDHLQLSQPPLNGMFGQSVAFVGDLNLDGLPEIMISSPRNERDHLNNLAIPNSTHAAGRAFRGSITVIPGANYDGDLWRDKSGAVGSTYLPVPGDQNPQGCRPPGNCGAPAISRCGPVVPSGTFEIFAEDVDDMLGGARSPGDFNQDSVPDIVCGAPMNGRGLDMEETGAMYIIFARTPVGDIDLTTADDPATRPPMLRIRGETPGDRIGWKQDGALDVNGDRIDDVIFSSPWADFIVSGGECFDPSDPDALNLNLFNNCRGEDIALDNEQCKRFDYNNDRAVDDDDRAVLDCLIAGGETECCPVDNGYVAIVFGGQTRQGDRTISQVGTSALGGVIFYGTNPGDRAGHDVSSAGDFDKDGFGDFLISAPGEIRVDDNGRRRMGVTYLIYGGPHLDNQEVPIELSEVGDRIPGIVFLSPYEAAGPDEAPTDTVGFLGDINNDGFGDIAIGVTRADLLDEDFPQGEGDPNATGRRPNQGDVYIIYGNNVNRP